MLIGRSWAEASRRVAVAVTSWSVSVSVADAVALAVAVASFNASAEQAAVPYKAVSTAKVMGWVGRSAFEVFKIHLLNRPSVHRPGCAGRFRPIARMFLVSRRFSSCRRSLGALSPQPDLPGFCPAVYPPPWNVPRWWTASLGPVA